MMLEPVEAEPKGKTWLVRIFGPSHALLCTARLFSTVSEVSLFLLVYKGVKTKPFHFLLGVKCRFVWQARSLLKALCGGFGSGSQI